MSSALVNQVLGLPPDERLALVDLIWDSLNSDAAGTELTKDQKIEIDGRMARYKTHPLEQAAWGEVRARLMKRVA